MIRLPHDRRLTDANRRLRFLLCWFLMFIALLLGYLAHLQITMGESFALKSRRNFLRYERVDAPRGTIFDCRGRVMATTKPVIRLLWQRPDLRPPHKDDILLLQFLEHLLQVTLLEEEHFHPTHRSARVVVVSENLSFEQLSIVVERFPNHPCLVFETHFRRDYPLHTQACHVVGYLNALRQDGIMGLEKVVETDLLGIPGKREFIVNARGIHMGRRDTEKALQGNHITTTIDIDVQALAESVLEPTVRGACVVIDPSSGALRALVSSPRFDPERFLAPLSSSEWNALQRESSLLNRACNASYPPASLFKLVTSSMILEERLVAPEAQWTCRGSYTFAGRPYKCNRSYGHGPVTLKQAVAYSCNIPFFDTAARTLSIDTLASYARKFGLGEKTNILFAEQAGLIPTSSWKRTHYGQPWWRGETLSAVIGQSFLLVTPLQMACLASSLCTGWTVKPRILEREEIVKSPLAVSHETLHFLQEAMHLSTGEGGTSALLKNMPGWNIKAKTGTAQTCSLKRAAENEKEATPHHAWFIGYGSYNDQPPIAIAIMIEHGGSARVATLAAKRFFRGYSKLLEEKNRAGATKF